VNTEQLAATTIKVLSMDAVQRANSGHPGMPMGMADIATVLWSKHLVVDPTDPTWADRDRFVLSNGGIHRRRATLSGIRSWGSR